MQPTLNIALRAARIASEQIARAMERLDIIRSEQESVSDFIRETASHAEKSVAHTLLKANPQHRVFGQLSGQLDSNSSGDTEWFITPIDSIRNYERNIPMFALCLVCKEKGRTEHSVIINPIVGEEFTASRGRGAQLNGKRIRVTAHKTTESSYLGSSLGAKTGQHPHLNGFNALNGQLSEQGAELLITQSSALTLAYVAAGRLDGCTTVSIEPNVIDAGSLLLVEAGALVADFIGGSNYGKSGNLVAANPRLFKQLLQTIRPALSEELRR